MLWVADFLFLEVQTTHSLPCQAGSPPWSHWQGSMNLIFQYLTLASCHPPWDSLGQPLKYPNFLPPSGIMRWPHLICGSSSFWSLKLVAAKIKTDTWSPLQGNGGWEAESQNTQWFFLKGGVYLKWLLYTFLG